MHYTVIVTLFIMWMRGCYCAIVYVGFLQYPLLVCFLFYFQSLLYTLIYLLFTPSSLTTNFPVWYRVRSAQMVCREGGGCMGGIEVFFGLAHKFMLAHDLMYHPNAQLRVPVCLPVPQGPGESRYTDHTWVQSCNHNCDLTIFQPQTWEMGLPFFSAMIGLCCASTTRDSLPSTASTESTKGDFSPLIM